MIKANVLEAKTHLSRLLDQVEQGAVVILCRHNKPVAEMRKIKEEAAPLAPPQFGLWDGFGVSPGFFDALPAEVLAAFEGRA